jgi:multidrug efflux pump
MAGVGELEVEAELGDQDGQVFALAPPAIQGMGTSDGFDFYLQDVNGAGHAKLIEARNQLLAAATKSSLLANTRPNGQEDTPQFSINIDQEKASALGISLSDVDGTLSTAWGSDYVNDFIDRGRVKKVYLQSDADFRMQPEDLSKWQVRNSAGTMVPFSSFASSHWTFGSPRLERYNGASAVHPRRIEKKWARRASAASASNTGASTSRIMGQRIAS